MTVNQAHLQADNPGAPVRWMDAGIAPVHPDLDKRVVVYDDPASWEPTSITGLEVRILEYLPIVDGRLAALCRQVDPDHSLVLPFGPGTEFLVQQGDVQLGDSHWPAGLYVRQPDALPEGDIAALSLCAAGDSAGSAHERRALIYFSVGHLPVSDNEPRVINTRDENRWLPGPVQGTEVLPLHGHGTANAMLVRWQMPVAFQPRLDPLGEELLVLSGTLHDAEGSYPAGTWIRNPVTAWQSWAGEAGTVVLYKSGHFSSTAGVAVSAAAVGDGSDDTDDARPVAAQRNTGER